MLRESSRGASGALPRSARRPVRYPVAAAQMRRLRWLGVRSSWPTPQRCTRWSQRSELLIAARPASAGSTPRWTAAPAGATPSPTGFARIALGIEDTDDLLADVERALGP